MILEILMDWFSMDFESCTPLLGTRTVEYGLLRTESTNMFYFLVLYE
jgi:hypothetical protein